MARGLARIANGETISIVERELIGLSSEASSLSVKASVARGYLSMQREPRQAQLKLNPVQKVHNAFGTGSEGITLWRRCKLESFTSEIARTLELDDVKPV